MKMKSLRLFLLAFAATITIGAFAQDSVIPSRLRVQSIGVGNPAPTTNGDARVNRVGVGAAAIGSTGDISQSSTGEPRVIQCTTAGGAGNRCAGWRTNNAGDVRIDIADDSGAVVATAIQIDRTGTVVNSIGLNAPVTATSFAGTHTGDGSGLTNLTAANIAAGTLAVARGGTGVTASTGSGNVVLSTSPALTTPTVGGQQVCRVDGVNCPAAVVVARTLASGIGSCSLTNSIRVTGCTRNSAGNYSVTFTGGTFSSDPVCAVTENTNATSTNHITVQTFNANQITVRTGNSAGTATDINFEMVCIGG